MYSMLIIYFLLFLNFLVITPPLEEVPLLQIIAYHLIAFFSFDFFFSSSLPSHLNISYEDFLSALRQYAACEQRLGK